MNLEKSVLTRSIGSLGHTITVLGAHMPDALGQLWIPNRPLLTPALPRRAHLTRIPVIVQCIVVAMPVLSAAQLETVQVAPANLELGHVEHSGHIVHDLT